MNRKQVIETLEMENDLICFNPLTGEEIPLEYVNGLNRQCYDAHLEAIRLINNSIPVEWFLDKEKKIWSKSEMTRFDFQMIEVIDELLGAWEKENESISI